MKKIGLIENMSYSPDFFKSGYEYSDASVVMSSTGGNTGNVAFVYGVRKILGDSVTLINWSTPPEIVNRDVDHIVICCANQLGEHVDLAGWADRISNFDKPITLIGLGAQAPDMTEYPRLPDGTLRFLSIVDERKVGSDSNIVVRGNYTQKFLSSLGINAIAAGCPSLHISPVHNLGKKILERQSIRDVKRVAIAAGNPWHGPSAPLELTLVDLVNKYQGEYIIQHPLSMLQYCFNEIESIEPKTIERFKVIYGEHIGDLTLAEWFRRYSSVFVDVPNWKRFLTKFDLVLGPRYHGVALGIQAGIPGCVITIDSRTEELCEGTGIKSIPLSEAFSMERNDFINQSLWSEVDADLFDRKREEQAIKYTKLFADNRLALSDHAKSLFPL